MSYSIPDPIPDDATPEQLRHIANYWRLEAQGYAFRWNLAMQYGDNLKAEVERLRKAGDSVVLCLCADTPEFHKQDCAKAWLAAKEVQS